VESHSHDINDVVHAGAYRGWMAPGARNKFDPPRSFGSKFTVLKKVLATLLGLFSSPRDSVPGTFYSFSSSLRPWIHVTFMLEKRKHIFGLPQLGLSFLRYFYKLGYQEPNIKYQIFCFESV